VDDMAAASVFVMELDQAGYDLQTEPICSHINVGYGSDVSIVKLANAVCVAAAGYSGKTELDSSRPDGVPRKWMDSRRLNNLGWQTQVDLDQGLAHAYADFSKRTLIKILEI
jgi:GDP-L-fucose synthase